MAIVLDLDLDLGEAQVSTSSLFNETVGVCPKCAASMQLASTATEQVYFCPTCSVSEPLQTSD